MKNTVLKTPLIAASLGVLLGLPGAMAATVTWSDPLAIGDGTTGAFSVSTGHVVFAADKVSSNTTAVTVGGIVFSNESTVNLSTADGGFSSNTSNYTGSADADMNALLDSRFGSFNGTNNTVTITLSGLELGNEYNLTLYFADTARDPDRILTATGGASTSSSFKGEDQVYLAGTFTADGTTQVITVDGTGDNTFPIVSGVLVTTIPEPSAALLGGLGMLGLLRRRR